MGGVPKSGRVNSLPGNLARAGRFTHPRFPSFFPTMSLMSSRQIQTLIRPVVRGLTPYVPGEQPKIKCLIKLNTNENPYPPSPRVLEATRAAVDGRLRLYPNPTAQLLRDKLARLHDCRPENIIVGNGSDELLAMAVRAFVEPRVGRASRLSRAGQTPALLWSKSTVQFFTPSYSLYPVPPRGCPPARGKASSWE